VESDLSIFEFNLPKNEFSPTQQTIAYPVPSKMFDPDTMKESIV